jgi:hypothetical protein
MTEAEQKLLDALAPEGSDEQMSAKDELIDLARIYLAAYQAEKEAKTRKDQLRGPLMELISEVVREEVPLAVKTVKVPREELDQAFSGDARAWAALKYPEWEVTGFGVDNADPENYAIAIQESDALAKYEFEVDGYKFGRTTAQSAPQIDIDGLRTDPEFEALGAEDVIVEETVYSLDERAASAFLLSHPESGVVFSRYTKPGEVTAKFLPFKKMKEGEV